MSCNCRKYSLPQLTGSSGTYFNELYSLNPGAGAWTGLSPTGDIPTAREAVGFAATPDGMLYLFGGLQSPADGG
jgi:hypothetical protein